MLTSLIIYLSFPNSSFSGLILLFFFTHLLGKLSHIFFILESMMLPHTSSLLDQVVLKPPAEEDLLRNTVTYFRAPRKDKNISVSYLPWAVNITLSLHQQTNKKDLAGRRWLRRKCEQGSHSLQSG